MVSHYTTLGVAPGADHDEIRRAYHGAARQWHPDRFAGKSAPEAQQAEESMRAVNEAWRVLGDDERRKAYDLSLQNPQTSGPTRESSIRTDDGVTRIDPRLLDPEFLASRRFADEVTLQDGHASVIRVVPVLALFGLLLGIFIFTAYSASGRTDVVEQETIDVGFQVGECVRILPGPQLLITPCTAQSDGVIIAAFSPDPDIELRCPVTSINEVELASEITVCLGNP